MKKKTTRKQQIKKVRPHFAFIAASPLTFDGSTKYLAHYQSAMDEYCFKFTATPWPAKKKGK